MKKFLIALFATMISASPMVGIMINRHWHLSEGEVVCLFISITAMDAFIAFSINAIYEGLKRK